MSGYILRRGGQSLVALMALLVLVFFLSRLTGNPTDLYMPMDASLDQREAFATKHGFNDPLYVQFGTYLVNIAKFDFGDSIFQGRPAMQAALEAFPVTLRLALITMVLALGLSVLIGSLAAYRPGGLFDRVASLVTISSA